LRAFKAYTNYIMMTHFCYHRCRTKKSIISCCSSCVFCSDWYWIL